MSTSDFCIRCDRDLSAYCEYCFDAMRDRLVALTARQEKRTLEVVREAILVSLHEERRRLTQARRLGQASKGDEEYLLELKQYIDEWQAHEVSAAKKDDVWARLDALASTLLSAQAESHACIEPPGRTAYVVELEREVTRLRGEVADLRDDIAAGEQGREFLRSLVKEAQRAAREADAEAARLRGLFDAAGQGEHNVLSLIDHYQRNSIEADARLRAVRKLLEDNGCDCPCEHHWEDHDDDCERCLACGVADALEVTHG